MGIGVRRLVADLGGIAGELAAVVAGTSTVRAPEGDRRFRDPAYQQHPLFRRLAQTHLVLEQRVAGLLAAADLDEAERYRRAVLLDLLTEALAPSNSLLGNPAALRALWRTRGRSVLQGLARAAGDLAGHGGLPSLADRGAFRVGVDVAASPGAVIHRDELFELIQYTPATSTVRARPLLFVPSQVNKFYVTDLGPARSLVRHLTGQGFQPFTISWCNPTSSQDDVGLGDYAAAVRRAVRVIVALTGEPVDVIGMCAGAAAAVVASGQDAEGRIASLTLLVAMVDASEPSLIGAICAPWPLAAVAAAPGRGGVVAGSGLGLVFALLRPRELIWQLWATSYLMGEAPPANDVLFWSDDTTNLPARLHADLLTLLRRPEIGAQLLGRVRCDTYVLGGLADHIAPWTAGWRTAAAAGPDTTFVAARGGHIQALLTPPGRPGGYAARRVGDAPDPQQWTDATDWTEGSWWEHWTAWLAARADRRVPAPRLGSAAYPPLDDAPGRFVHA